MHSCFTLIRSILAGVGVVWLFLEPYYTLKTVAPGDRLGIWSFVAISVVVGLAWFAIDGFFVSGYLKRSITLASNAFDTRVTIKFGDLFRQDGWKAISVNEYFDSTVDNEHVAEQSLHGMMLMKYWEGQLQDFDQQVVDSLNGVAPRKTSTVRTEPGKSTRYPIGTTATATRNGNRFLCVALARTNTKTLQASASLDDLHKALRGLLQKARTACSGQPLNIPLLGSGLARIGIKPNIIVDLILLAIFEESKSEKIMNDIHIVLPKQLRRQIDLTTLQKDWG